MHVLYLRLRILLDADDLVQTRLPMNIYDVHLHAFKSQVFVPFEIKSHIDS